MFPAVDGVGWHFLHRLFGPSVSPASPQEEVLSFLPEPSFETKRLFPQNLGGVGEAEWS